MFRVVVCWQKYHILKDWLALKCIIAIIINFEVQKYIIIHHTCKFISNKCISVVVAFVDLLLFTYRMTMVGLHSILHAMGVMIPVWPICWKKVCLCIRFCQRVQLLLQCDPYDEQILYKDILPMLQFIYTIALSQLLHGIWHCMLGTWPM